MCIILYVHTLDFFCYTPMCKHVWWRSVVNGNFSVKPDSIRQAGWDEQTHSLEVYPRRWQTCSQGSCVGPDTGEERQAYLGGWLSVDDLEADYLCGVDIRHWTGLPCVAVWSAHVWYKVGDSNTNIDTLPLLMHVSSQHWRLGFWWFDLPGRRGGFTISNFEQLALGML